MRTVIFDLDGTLADTSVDLLAAANHCFGVMGLGDMLTHPEDAKIALRGGKRMLTEGLTRAGQFKDATVEEYYPVLLEAYRDGIDTHTVMYPGAMDAVEALKAAGYGVGICTNKPSAATETALVHNGMSGLFRSIVSGDTLAYRKPAKEPLLAVVDELGAEQAIFVGDSEVDAETAQAAGIPFVLFQRGYLHIAEQDVEKVATFDNYADLPDILASL